MADTQQLSPAATTPPVKSTLGWEVVAYAGALAASLVTVWVNVRQSFYMRMRRGPFKSIDVERSGKIDAVGARLLGGLISKETYERERDAIRAVSQAKWDKGIEKLGIRNTWDRFQNINFYDKFKIGAVGLTVFSVAMGAIISMRHRSVTNERLAALEARQQQTQSAAR